MALAPRHGRFLVALIIGGCAAAVGAVTLVAASVETLVLIGANGVFAAYLALTLRFSMRSSAEDLRRHAETADEGAWLILLLAAVVVAVSLTAIFRLVAGAASLQPVMALTAVPLGWAMIHSMAAFHYAHVFYSAEAAIPALDFPGTAEPGPADFLYFAFGIGMTAQVSDVVTKSADVRRVVTAHAVASFFYNTVILALAVNAAVTAGS